MSADDNAGGAPTYQYQTLSEEKASLQRRSDQRAADFTASTGETLTLASSGASSSQAVAYSSAPAYSTNPGASTMIVTAAPVIASQPSSASRRVFSVDQMDPGSQLNYAAVRSFHQSGVLAQENIQSAATQALGMVDTTVAHLKDNITYEDLLQTLIHDNERILTKDWRLLYRQATFFDCEEPSHPIVDNLPCGAAILTNKRLLLLSAQVHKGLLLQNIGTNKKTRRYVVQATNSDNVHYKPLPLSNFASVEMSASAGASVTADVDPLMPCCGGLCSCFGSCCLSARKQWSARISATDNYNTRVLKIGLLLPPWGRRCMLHLDLDPQMPLSFARDFIGMLQQHPKLAA